MTHDPVTVDASQTLVNVARLMRDHDTGAVIATDGGKVRGIVTDRDLVVRRHDVRRLPVVDRDRPIGIVSLGDIAIERDENSTLTDISAAAPNQ